MPAPKRSKELQPRVDAVRRFNRFYTSLVGALDEAHLSSPYTLAEVRLLFELAHRESPTAATLVAELGLDAGYLSRMLRKLERRRLVKRTRSAADGRESHLALTAAGRAAFRSLDSLASDAIARLIEPLDESGQRRLVDAMSTIGTLLGAPTADTAASEPAYILRPPRPGDLGWIVHRHGVLFTREFGFNLAFEALVAEIVADYVESYDPAKDSCWIAERKGERVGSVFLVKDSARPGVARLRLLLLEPSARGLGIGRRLVDECTRFAREAGYHTISLFTTNVLTAARRIYADAGYRLVHEEPHTAFGPKLTAETWELSLRPER
jgi:DNA-binding MarR family transcriptional regulator/GNAT superfamily N-acetyltransferase